MKVFTGRWYDAMGEFNAWAKGKALTKEVIIHTHVIPNRSWESTEERVLIIVIHPEGQPWEQTEPQLTAPVHIKPEPHIKIEEIKVTQ